MIRVNSLDEIPQPARDRIKAKVMRRFITHLQDRPEISDETLRTALGFDRDTLEAMYADLSARARAEQDETRREPAPAPEPARPAPLVGGLVAGQAPMAQSFLHPANETAPTRVREPERGYPAVSEAGGGSKLRRD